jgi:ATPase subunit of ABC transporter with duplicated ATPase domains
VAEQTRLDAPGSRPTLYDPRRTPASSPARRQRRPPLLPCSRNRDIQARTGGNDVLELQGLTRRYGDLVVLDDLSFTVREGQMFGFIGPNGAGKTTAMRIVRGR